MPRKAPRHGAAPDARSVRTVLLVRHAKAESRRRWRQPDHLRPLNDRGRAQANVLAELLGALPICQVRTSPALRCRETVEPLCQRLGVECVVDHDLMEGGQIDLPSDPGTYVICAHGDNIPALLDDLHIEWSDCRKASVWRLDFDQNGTLIGATYTECPSP